MSPIALEKAFELYPEVRLIIVAHLYGTPGKMEEIKRIADAHGALIVEDAAESLGAKYKLNGEWVETGNRCKDECLSDMQIRQKRNPSKTRRKTERRSCTRKAAK